jgi:hypothetical protein
VWEEPIDVGKVDVFEIPRSRAEQLGGALATALDVDAERAGTVEP